MTKRFEAKAGDRWTRFRDGSGMVMRGLGGEVLLVGRHMRAPVEISESSISGELEDLPTPEAHAQLRAWGYEVVGDEQPITESRVKEIVEQVMKSALDKLDDHYDIRCDSLAVRMDNMDHALASLRSLQEILSKEVDELQRAKAQPTPAEVREAIAIANDPNTKWHNITTKIVAPDFNGKEAVAPKPTAERLLANLVEAWNATYPLEAKLPESVLPFVNSPALAAARGYLAREYFASTKGMVK